ncbi:MAG: hypothetical protein ACOCVF_04005 [bacterium]
MTKLKTIWKYGLIFAAHKNILLYSNVPRGKILYLGKIDDMDREIAENVAEIHHKYENYFDETLMILYKTYGKYRGGTECPVKSIASLRTEKEIESGMDYILIYKIIE